MRNARVRNSALDKGFDEVTSKVHFKEVYNLIIL